MRHIVNALQGAGYISTRDAATRLGYTSSGGDFGGYLPKKLKELGVRHIQSPLGQNGRMTHLWLQEDIEKLASRRSEKRPADPAESQQGYGALSRRIYALEGLVDRLYDELGMSK